MELLKVLGSPNLSSNRTLGRRHDGEYCDNKMSFSK